MVPVTLKVILAPGLAKAIASRSVHLASLHPVPSSAKLLTTGLLGT